MQGSSLPWGQGSCSPVTAGLPLYGMALPFSVRERLGWVSARIWIDGQNAMHQQAGVVLVRPAESGKKAAVRGRMCGQGVESGGAERASSGSCLRIALCPRGSSPESPAVPTGFLSYLNSSRKFAGSPPFLSPSKSSSLRLKRVCLFVCL